MFVVGALAVLVGGDLSDRFSSGPLVVGSYAAVVVFVGRWPRGRGRRRGGVS